MNVTDRHEKCSDAIACEWPHCACGASVYPWAAKKHGIDREEWVRRFHARIVERARDGDGNELSKEDAAETGAWEIEQWPEAGDQHNGPDWMVTLPEEAADEQMGNWLEDQEP